MKIRDRAYSCSKIPNLLNYFVTFHQVDLRMELACSIAKLIRELAIVVVELLVVELELAFDFTVGSSTTASSFVRNS